MFEFKVGDIVKVIDTTGSLYYCSIKLGAVGEIKHYFNKDHIGIFINGRELLVCYDEIELIARGLK